jgi:hypothetical protein
MTSGCLNAHSPGLMHGLKLRLPLLNSFKRGMIFTKRGAS